MRRLIPLLPLLLLAIACGPDTTGTVGPSEAPTTDAPAASSLPPRGTVAGPDGAEIVFEAAGAGETTLVFVHCWSCDRSFWREQMGPFSESRRVVAIDLPGHGESDAQRDSWTIAGLAADVAAAVEGLDLGNVILVGHSMGGPVSLLAAPLAADRVVGVVLVDTVHIAEQVWSEEEAAPMINAFEEDFQAANAQFVPMLFREDADPALVAWVTERANASNVDISIALMKDFPNISGSDALAGAGVPVRAVQAAPLEMMIPPTDIEMNQRYADYDAAILEGVGHYLQLEKPEEFNALLEAAIADIEQR